jgi:hypothetical protein
MSWGKRRAIIIVCLFLFLGLILLAALHKPALDGHRRRD